MSLLIKALSLLTKVFFTLWFISILGIMIIYSSSYYLRYYEVAIPVAGTGSMYPTFPKGTKKTLREQAQELVSNPKMVPYPNGIFIFGKQYFAYQIKRGDIVDFENAKTREITQKLDGVPAGMIKRVVAFPGESIEIRDGIVFVNGLALKEPYIAQARSTFGGKTIDECRAMKIPDHKIVVMGDNRKVSGDSRHELGLIDYADVRYVLALEKQIGYYDKNWRDTSYDFKQSAKIKLNKNEYLALLNKTRAQAQVQALNYQPKLEEAAKKRGEIIIKFNDFSFEATKSGYTMKRAMQDAGYDNIVWGEAPIQGYYEASELLDNQMEFPSSKNFLLYKDYQDFGLEEVEGEINGCPTQVIVQSFAGYIPPNYKKEDIAAWKDLINKLREIQPSWQNLNNYSEFYNKHRQNIERINTIITTRISRAESIVNKMETNLWLTKEEERYIDEDKSLGDEQQKIASLLNQKVE